MVPFYQVLGSALSLQALYPTLDCALLRSVIETSKLGIASITAFIESLLVKDPPMGPKWRSDCSTWCQVLFLWQQVQLPMDHLLWKFCLSFLPQIPQEALCQGLIDASSDPVMQWTEENHVIRAMMAVVQEKHRRAFVELVALNNSYSAIMLLSNVLTFDK